MPPEDEGNQPPEQPAKLRNDDEPRPSLLGLDDPPKSLLGLDDDEPPKLLLGLDDDIEIDPEDEVASPPPKNQLGLDDEPVTAVEQGELPDDVQKPLEEAKDLLSQARLVSDDLFEQARNMPEYRRVLATPERNAQFESKLLAEAKKIDARLGTDLPDNVLVEVVDRMANSIAAWEHSPERQTERQKEQAAGRRRKNRGRDLQVVRAIENGESQRRVAARYDISRGAVEHILMRDAPHLLDRRGKDERPPD